MAKIIDDISRTFNEFLLLPGLTTKKHLPSNVSLETPIRKFHRDIKERITLKLPIVSGAMQAVSGPRLASALAIQGGLGFIFSSQSIASQAEMVREVRTNNLSVGAALNTHDLAERAPALIEAGADILCLDSSDGYSEWQAEAASELKSRYGDRITVGGGNVVTADGFRYLVEEGNVDFVKVGIGGGSICITREQKGIGRGQASAIIEVARERDRYFAETGYYVPICSDGGISSDTHLILALALGADFVMMGRYFAGCDETPNEKVIRDGKELKPYWGEGSARARNWQRYKQSEANTLVFEEGVDAFVPATGPLATSLAVTIAKLKSTMCNIGALTISEFYERARVTVVSEMTIVEGGTTSVLSA